MGVGRLMINRETQKCEGLRRLRLPKCSAAASPPGGQRPVRLPWSLVQFSLQPTSGTTLLSMTFGSTSSPNQMAVE